MLHNHLLVIATLASGAAAGGPFVIDGITFVDRGDSGEIDLGDTRGGIGVLDYDADGYPDLVLGDAAGLPARLFHNEPDPMHPGSRTFVDVTTGSGLDDADGVGRIGDGVAAADYDNDGDIDVFLVGRHADGTHGLLYRNDGGGQFANVSVESGVRATGYIAGSASWNDFDLDGWVDLLILCESGGAGRVRLLRNEGDCTFSDATSLVPAIPSGGLVYAHTWTDFDLDGWADCFAVWTGSPRTLHNVPDGAGGRRFDEVAAAIGFTTLGPAPMGISAGDHDNDGDFDLAVTNGVQGVYYDVHAGAVQQVFPFGTFFGWGVCWLDVENDGDLDHFQAGSFAQGANPDALLRNLGGGAWDNVSPALNGPTLPTRYAVQIDYDNDGRRDIIAMNPEDVVSVYQNQTQDAGAWATVSLLGDGALVNGSAIGSVVRVSAGGLVQHREVASGSSTTATEDLRPHFGLGGASQIDWIEVVWPRRGSLASRTERFDGPHAVSAIHAFSPGSPADVDRDGDVDGADLAMLLGSWGSNDGVADLTGDGVVGGDDLAILLGAWGRAREAHASQTRQSVQFAPGAAAGISTPSSSGLMSGRRSAASRSPMARSMVCVAAW